MAGLVKVFSGSAFVAKAIKYWSGVAWVQGSMRHWDGSQWVPAPGGGGGGGASPALKFNVAGNSQYVPLVGL